jgi:hypothetical protein
MDLAAVADRYGFENLCARAIRKDAGFDPQLFREMLGRFSRLPRDEFEMPDPAFQRLEHVVDEWRGKTNNLTRGDLDRRLEQLDRGDELGLDL